jgi:hypothetical protein
MAVINMNVNTEEYTSGTSVAKMTPDVEIVNDQKVSMAVDSEKYNIMKATQLLNQNGAAQFTSTTDISLDALNLLNALGCTVVSDLDANYSLLNAQEDEETFTNPNIIKPSALGTASTVGAVESLMVPQSTIAAKPLDTATSFPNADDPFYEVDAGQSEFVETEQKIAEKIDAGTIAITLAADIAQVNIDDEYDTGLVVFNISM